MENAALNTLQKNNSFPFRMDLISGVATLTREIVH